MSDPAERPGRRGLAGGACMEAHRDGTAHARAGGAMFVSPALQRWETGPKMSRSPVGTVHKLPALRRLCEPSAKSPTGSDSRKCQKFCWRVAPVSRFYSKNDKGAHGPSQLGTGEISNPNPVAPDPDCSARVAGYSEIVLSSAPISIHPPTPNRPQKKVAREVKHH